MTTPRRAGSSPFRSDPRGTARYQRDAALERSRSVTKGIAFASVAAVAAAGVYLSQSLPGHSATSTSSSTTPAGAGVVSGSSASSSGDDPSGSVNPNSTSGSVNPNSSGVSAPASAPVQAPVGQQAPVVSGSS